MKVPFTEKKVLYFKESITFHSTYCKLKKVSIILNKKIYFFKRKHCKLNIKSQFFERLIVLLKSKCYISITYMLGICIAFYHMIAPLQFNLDIKWFFKFLLFLTFLFSIIVKEIYIICCGSILLSL